MIRYIAPVCFVILWSTGWIAARYVVDFADPFLFLLYRFVLAGGLLALMASLAGVHWPKRGVGPGPRGGLGRAAAFRLPRRRLVGDPAGAAGSVSALIAALQPILTALFAPFVLGERFGLRRGLGVGLGFLGLYLVLAPRLAALAGIGAGPSGLLILVNFLAMVSATAGTFYQKRFVREGDLRAVGALQYAGATLVILPVAFLFGDLHFQWSLFAGAVLGWSVLGISIGAVVLLLVLIRDGEVTRASQLLFLAPPVAAIQAMILFGDQLSPLQFAGMALSAAGVALAMGPVSRASP